MMTVCRGRGTTSVFIQALESSSRNETSGTTVRSLKATTAAAPPSALPMIIAAPPLKFAAKPGWIDNSATKIRISKLPVHSNR